MLTTSLFAEEDGHRHKDRGVPLHMRHLKDPMGADGTTTTSADGEAPVTPQKRKLSASTNMSSVGERARHDIVPKSSIASPTRGCRRDAHSTSYISQPAEQGQSQELSHCG